MGLINDHSAGIRQDRAPACALVDGIGQQEIVVADLKGKLSVAAVLQEGPVAAVLLSAVADLGDAYPVPVIAAEMGNAVHIQVLPQRKQPFNRPFIFLAELDLEQPPFQSLSAGVVEFPLADYRRERLVDHTVLQHGGG